MREEKLGILCSGRGSNLASIIEAIEREEIPAEIAVVIADKRDAYALERARAKGIPTVAVVYRDYAERADFERAMLDEMHAHGVTLVVLARFRPCVYGSYLEHPPCTPSELSGGTCPS